MVSASVVVQAVASGWSVSRAAATAGVRWRAIRHHRAAAAWSSGRSPSLAAVSSRRRASRPDAESCARRWASMGVKSSPVAWGARWWRRGPHSVEGGLVVAGEAAVEVALPAAAALASCRSPVGRVSASGTFMAARHTVRSAIVWPVGCPRQDASQAGVRFVVSACWWTVSARSATRARGRRGRCPIRGGRGAAGHGWGATAGGRGWCSAGRWWRRGASRGQRPDRRRR